MGSSEKVMPFRAGEWIQVKEWEEIAQTLDADGTLDGLPFMPEMLESCGRQYQVLRYAGQLCVEAPGGIFLSRVFAKPDDIVLLNGVRCSGQSHDGCQRSCMIFWKTAWLRKCQGARSADPVLQTQHVLATERLKVKESPTKYFCQATQLMKISCMQRRKDTLSQVWRDLRTGAIGIFQMIFLVVRPCFNKLRRNLWGWPHMGGTLARTPVEHLGLKAGDLVEVKSLKEIQATLNSAGRNRGLQCDKGFAPFCVKQFTVRGRLDRLISEDTGQMRVMDSTVTLEGASCPCAFSIGGCTRYDFTYFREIWLRKIPNKEEVVRKCRE